jgi:hypothetical protein
MKSELKIQHSLSVAYVSMKCVRLLCDNTVAHMRFLLHGISRDCCITEHGAMCVLRFMFAGLISEQVQLDFLLDRTARVFRSDSPGEAAQWLARSIRES